MKIAVVGAGLAGLAITWHLIQKGADVTVFDVGKGASHASTGLLHPYPGKKALPTFRAQEGMEAAIELLEIASKRRPVFERSGILRFAINDEQRALFKGDSIWIPEGISVYSRLYLEELKKECAEAKFISTTVNSIDELEMFDASVIAAGVETLKFIDLSLKRTIGQGLLCRCKKKLPHAMLGSGHITPTEDSEYCLVGSTYEHTEEPDEKKAYALIEKVAAFYPEAKDFEIIEVRSGIRSSPKIGVQPIIQKCGPKAWVFTGLGSRGLIYHALFARELVSQLQFAKDSITLPSIIPGEENTARL